MGDFGTIELGCIPSYCVSKITETGSNDSENHYIDF